MKKIKRKAEIAREIERDARKGRKGKERERDACKWVKARETCVDFEKEERGA